MCLKKITSQITHKVHTGVISKLLVPEKYLYVPNSVVHVGRSVQYGLRYTLSARAQWVAFSNVRMHTFELYL